MRIPTPKIHNKILSNFKSAPADSPRAKSRLPAGTAQEAVGPSPGPHLSPDARGNSPRKNPRGPAPSGAILPAPDACGNLPQKKTRTPVPVHQGRSRRGRPYPQNRDGSGNAGKAEGSLPRLAPEGQGFEQEISLLRSMINRLLSRRPLNHTYISRYMRLLIQAQSAQAKAPRELTDEQEVDYLIKKVFHKEVEDGVTSYYDLLPVRTARPGDKWWPWRQLVSIDERRRDGLIGPDAPRLQELEEAESSYYGNPFDDEDPDDEYEQLPDPDNESPYDPDQLSPDPDDDDDYDPDDPDSSSDPDSKDPDDEDPPPEPSVIPDPACPREIGGESIPRGVAVRPSPSPVGVPLVGTLDAAHADTGRSPGWADPVTPTNSKSPRIARGRPPP